MSMSIASFRNELKKIAVIWPDSYANKLQQIRYLSVTILYDGINEWTYELDILDVIPNNSPSKSYNSDVSKEACGLLSLS